MSSLTLEKLLSFYTITNAFAHNPARERQPVTTTATEHRRLWGNRFGLFVRVDGVQGFVAGVTERRLVEYRYLERSGWRRTAHAGQRADSVYLHGGLR